MKIIHMSDIHLTEYGKEIWDVNTMFNFNNAIEIIRGIKDIDAIIVTGDLSDDGSKWSYDYIAQRFKNLKIPVFCCPGNHDNRETMDMSNIGSFFVSNYHTNINEYDLIILNSTLLGMSRGLLCNESIVWLENILSGSVRPTIIAFHHPCIEPGGWLNRKLLENRNEFIQIISKYPYVKLVLYGHIHYNIQHLIKDCVFSAAPSIGFAFDKNLPKFKIANGNEGFNIITIDDHNINIETILL